MPINFRCPTCDRTLSIATRKAGTQVDCPKCGVKVRVPAGTGAAVPVAAGSPALEALPLFERTDFESLFEPVAKAAALPKPAPVKAEPPKIEAPKPVTNTPTVTPAAFEPSPFNLDDVDVAELDGVMVNRAKMTWITIVVAVLLVLSFAVGYFLGRATGPKAAQTVTSPLLFCG